MRTENRSRTPILPSVIVIGVLAFTASFGGDNAGIVAAPPQLQALLLSCHQDSQRYTLTLLAPSARTRGSAGRTIGEAGQTVATALPQEERTRTVELTPAGCN